MEKKEEESGERGGKHGHLFQKRRNVISGGESCRRCISHIIFSDHSRFLITEGEEGHNFIVFVLHHCKNRK